MQEGYTYIDNFKIEPIKPGDRVVHFTGYSGETGFARALDREIARRFAAQLISVLDEADMREDDPDGIILPFARRS